MSAFDVRRYGRILRFDLLSRSTDQLLPLVVPPALFLLGALFRLVAGGTTTTWPTTCFFVAMALGVVAGALAHRSEINPGTAPFQMLLPVSHAERFLARWTTSFALTFFGQLALLTLLANLMAGLGQLLGHAYGGPILPDAAMVGRDLGAFLMFHSVFFAGGIFFRSNPAIKTILAAIAYGVSFAAFAGILALARLSTMGPLSTSWSGNVSFDAASIGPMTLYVRLSWQVLFPALLYLAAYYRARENEVRG